MVRSAAHSSAAAAGGFQPRSAVAGSSAVAIASSSRVALAGPRPGTSRTTRKPASRLRGLCAQRSSASRSFTWLASRKRRPPNFTKGMLRRVSSSSSAALWWPVRNSTAWRFSVSPCSRWRSTSSATQRACAASSATVTSRGRAEEARSLHSVFANRSGASAMTAFDAASSGCVLR